MIGLRAARIVTGESGDAICGPRWLTVDGDRIVSVDGEPPAGAVLRDLGELQLWPGIVDLHADSLARFESPRAGTRIPLDVALHDFTVDAVSHGIVQPYLCVSVGEGPDPQSGYARAHTILQTLDVIEGVLPVPVRVHLRVDTGDPGSIAAAEVLLDRHADRIRLVSTMNHTPGQGQYRDEVSWRAAMGARLHLGDGALEHWLTRLRAVAAEDPARRRAGAELTRSAGAVYATHDPGTAADVRDAHENGARICEFPITAGAAASAHGLGIGVVMGAPNAWRGASHLDNLSAREAIAAGTVDALTSDYHSGAMVRAAIELVRAGLCSADRAVGLMTVGPARLVDVPAPAADGVLAEARPATMIAVRTGPIPAVVATWFRGRQVGGPLVEGRG
ncbi:hypothetical protein [Nocardia jiangxiensis]|uniref:hypothetical protein n=1 Tax=Nocardia jiangxiensis TaxID=282685 RepID=UPI000308FA49|nr:hypothetical protein [Nocardia jiangxiensis]